MMDYDLQRVYEEAYRLSEARLQSEISAAMAADQRAVSFSGLTIATAALLAGFFEKSDPNYGLLISSAFLVAAAVLAFYSARPIPFYMPGRNFSDFYEDFKKRTEFLALISELGQQNDKSSESNNIALKQNSRLMKTAMIFAAIGLVIAITSQVYASVGQITEELTQ